MSRVVWERLETINAVTYFAPECRDAFKQVGLRAFWMGYIAGRAAPMGAVPAEVVEAAFYNFHPAMVRRAIPDAWNFAAPEAVVATRSRAAGDAILRLAPDAPSVCDELLPLLRRAIDHCTRIARPLFASNRAITLSGEPLADVWQSVTTLREHRGDGHVVILRESELDGCAAHVLFAANENVPAEVLRDNRGWSTTDWEDAADRLRARGLLDGHGEPTGAGFELRRHIEQRTDELAAPAYAALAAPDLDRLIALAQSIAEPIAASDAIPFPNPIGLPAPLTRRGR